jgi:hypothetical protein
VLDQGGGVSHQGKTNPADMPSIMNDSFPGAGGAGASSQTAGNVCSPWSVVGDQDYKMNEEVGEYRTYLRSVLWSTVTRLRFIQGRILQTTVYHSIQGTIEPL